MSEITITLPVDQHLLEDCISGCRQSQYFLYQRFAPKMFGICLRYAHDYHHAEDILQEGFFKAFNNLHRFGWRGSFEGWLKRIFINTAIEHYRKLKSQYRFADLEAANQVVIDPEVLHYLAREDLLALIQKLPYGYRTVFNLYVIEGFIHREIAALLHITENTSKSQLARARAALQVLINNRDK